MVSAFASFFSQLTTYAGGASSIIHLWEGRWTSSLLPLAWSAFAYWAAWVDLWGADLIILAIVIWIVYEAIQHRPVIGPDEGEYAKKKKFWKINGEYYDLTKFDFLDRHPGGPEMLLLARDFSSDQTYAVESHHANWRMIRQMIKRYKVDPPEDADPISDAKGPKFCPENSFYSVFRDRVHEYIKENGSGPGGPAMAFYYVSLALWFVSFGMLWWTGSYWWELPLITTSLIIGGYGHSFIHQPKYRWHAYTFDLIGFSSQAWYAEHNLQHHMFTNSAGDNHFEGTNPFLPCDPTTARTLMTQIFAVPLFFLVLAFGVVINYVMHLAQILNGKGNGTKSRKWDWGKLIVPLELALMYWPITMKSTNGT